jgi:hypothetical protein
LVFDSADFSNYPKGDELFQIAIKHKINALEEVKSSDSVVKESVKY